MSNYKVDYSELVYAIQQNKAGKANELLEEILYRLKDYLKVVFNATENEAEECTQQVFLKVYEQILKDNIKDEKYIFRYLISTCRHEYFRFKKEQKRYKISSDNFTDHLVEPAKQIENLMEKDRQRVLGECFDELGEEERVFIDYLMEKPDSSSKQLSSYFNIKRGYARAKKSRILEQLRFCVKRKLRR